MVPLTDSSSLSPIGNYFCHNSPPGITVLFYLGKCQINLHFLTFHKTSLILDRMSGALTPKQRTEYALAKGCLWIQYTPVSPSNQIRLIKTELSGSIYVKMKLRMKKIMQLPEVTSNNSYMSKLKGNAPPIYNMVFTYFRSWESKGKDWGVPSKFNYKKQCAKLCSHTWNQLLNSWNQLFK